MANVLWIKLMVDLFDHDKIKLIDSPENQKKDLHIVLWVKLLCLAGHLNRDGALILNDKPYSDAMLAATFKRNSKAVSEALALFVEYGMLVKNDNTYAIKNWSKYQDFSKLTDRNEKQREYQQRYRDKQKGQDVSANVSTNDDNEAIENANELDNGYDSVSAFPSISTSTSTSISYISNSQDILPGRVIELYKLYAPGIYKKEEDMWDYTVKNNIQALYLAIDEDREKQPLTEERLIELFKTAEASEYIKTWKNATMATLLGKREAILSGRYKELFRKEKPESDSFANSIERAKELIKNADHR